MIISTSIGLAYEEPTANTSFGTSGKSNGQFNTPQDIVVDSGGNVYVSDTANNRIEKFSSSGNFVSSFGEKGKNDGQFAFPKGITIDNQGNIYVVDQSNNRIEKFSSSGNFVSSFGEKGKGDGQFNRPRDIAIDSSGNFFVTDQQNNRVQKFDSNGHYISQFGSIGVGDGQFKQPSGITIDKNNRIYVVDYSNNRYQIFTSSGTNILSVGRLGVGEGQFDSPEDITVDNDGNVYVSDTGNNRIQKFDSNGNFVYSFGQYGTLLGQFNEPRGLFLYQNALYVIDSINDRVQIITGLDNIVDTTSQSVITTGHKSERPPPQINGIGLFKILTKSDQETIIESQKFEDYFPYSMHSYISDSLNYGEQFVKVGQFFPMKGYSTEVLPVIAQKGDHIQIQIRLYDEYRGFNIEHVALYFTDMESTDIKKLYTFISYDKNSNVKISDPAGVFGDVKVDTSPEFDAYWAIFDIQFANPISSHNVLVETWNESHFPAYTKAENAIEVYDPILQQLDNPVLKTVEIDIPVIHTSPQCAAKKACFEPSDATVLKGGIVSWVNKDASFVHAITSGKPDSGPDNRFNGFLRPASTYEFQFNQLGDYPYYCAIHPWATGIVHVISKEQQSSYDPTKDVMSNSNISGKVTSPESIEYPIIIESIERGINRIIEVGKTISLETKNLSVEISGYVGKNPTHKEVQITIIHPDGSEDKFNTPVNSDGGYFIPTKLNSKWQSGNYEVIAIYNNIQIGNIPFKIKSVDERGFGGILPTPSVLTLVYLENYVNLTISEKQLDENLSKLGWSDSKIVDFKDRLRAMFYVDSPRQQISSGVNPKDVSCNVGLQLVLTKDGISKCVKIDSINKLLERELINKVVDSRLL